ncbi:MAG: pilus assembly protein N-terminal domain-containing protein, partial [Rhodobacteraceae bacterium]|nr:pilus assembly protein N-terminal domain-containing protein [Paracoccaceae bacterium]
MRTLRSHLLVWSAAAAALAAPAFAAEPIMVAVDQAKVMRIARPAETVIIGNPSIADATIKDQLTLIITGRSFGTTNLIVLDSEGEPIADQLLTVQTADQSQVTVYKAAVRQTYSCAPICEPVLNIGDNSTAFEQTNTQIQARS